MLEIIVSESEVWDEASNQFLYVPGVKLKLEHSLLSLSAWESKWCKPFLQDKEKTEEETIDYIRCMTLNPEEIDDTVYATLSLDNLKAIKDYISAPMTATWFPPDKRGNRNGEQVTSELIYYWMISLQIPMECQAWHLNKLMTLIRVCNVKNQPSKKHGKNDVLRQNAALNAARRKPKV